MFNKERPTSSDDKTAKPTTYPYSPNPAPRPNPDLLAVTTPRPAMADAPDSGSGSKLIVGPNIKLKGVEITDCDTLVVEGHVEATMDSRAIQIARSGSFNGTAGIDVAEIHGEFNGELTVRKRLLIHATGKVSGNIRYGKLVIEEGGEISGQVKTLGPEDAKRPLVASPRPIAAH